MLWASPREAKLIALLLGDPPEPIAHHHGFLDMTLMNSCLPALDFQTSAFEFKMKW